jgi:transposase
MTRPGRYPQELRERAVRLVFEHQDEHPSQWAAITSIAHKFGVSAETLRNWVRNAETDDGLRPGLTSEERERLRSLEREVRELRRANEILKSAAPDSTRQRNGVAVSRTSGPMRTTSSSWKRLASAMFRAPGPASAGLPPPPIRTGAM